MGTFGPRSPSWVEALLAWYAAHGRDLPWRRRDDPYAVWVSEIMLQQTRVETVIPYFEAWMRRFPTLLSLAAADEQDVLNAWEGLGYYSRARNLLKAARIVSAEYGGQLPRQAHALRALPGIGRYTAGAIASIAFGAQEPALDANIKRVYARLFAVSLPVGDPDGERVLWEMANKFLPVGQAGAFNQALMDLGAGVCTPRSPRCEACPIHRQCLAYAQNLQQALPVTRPKRPVPHYQEAAAVILEADRVLLTRRPPDGLLGGMWAFPSVRVTQDPRQGMPAGLRSQFGLNVRRLRPLSPVHHAYTHFRVSVHPYLCELRAENGLAKFEWVPVAHLERYPMGKVDRTIARALPVRDTK